MDFPINQTVNAAINPVSNANANHTISAHLKNPSQSLAPQGKNNLGGFSPAVDPIVCKAVSENR